MKLYDNRLEATALRTICNSHSKMAAARLMASVGADHFYDEITIEAFKRIRAIVERESRIPTWEELVIDPLIDSDTRSELEEYAEIKPIRRDRRIEHLFVNLELYRKARIVYFQSEKNLKTLEGKSVDIDGLLNENLEGLVQAQTSAHKEDAIITTGVNSNSDKLFETLLSDERADVIRTGLNTFDGRNGGISRGSMMLIAATTGGGKTAMKTQLEINIARNGGKVCGIPLEMTAKEQMARHVANIAGVDVKKYLFTKLTEREKKHSRKAWRAYERTVKKFGGALRIFEPEEDMSIEEILTLLRPYKDDVIIIDYIGLLKGVDGDDSWRQLGKAARYAKIWAKNNNRVVILLAQLSDEGSIRYSRAIVEHANNAWFWTYGDKNRETAVLDISQPKARNQEAFDFQLGHDFSTMRIFDLDGAQDEVAKEERRSDRGRERNRKLKRGIRNLERDSRRDRRDSGRREDRRGKEGRRRLRDRSA